MNKVICLSNLMKNIIVIINNIANISDTNLNTVSAYFIHTLLKT
jgi:hypothetical protein